MVSSLTSRGGEALGKTDLGGQRERPPARGLAERPGTLVQEGPQGFAASGVEDCGGGVWPGRLRLQRRKTALVERMNGIAYRLVGAAQVVRNRSGRLALGTGEQALAAAHGKGRRRPETGLERCPLVCRERAYI